MSFDPADHPHLRFNPLKGEWVLVSPHRSKRPWAGKVEEAPPVKNDSKNPLGPGNLRGNGERNPDYKNTHVFTNDFPALLPDTPSPPENDEERNPLFLMKPARGTCKVMCYHPRSDLHYASMELPDIDLVVEEWVKQYDILGAKYYWVQIMENRGEIMGCSNPHPHCQMWASDFYPNEPRVKHANLKKYHEKYNQPLLMDYLTKELALNERVVYENTEWVVLVPFWAFWPYETLVLPRRQVQRMSDLDTAQKKNLAVLLREFVAKYDNLFDCPFPYSMGFHGAPTGGDLKVDMPFWTFHAVFYPPLLRSATVQKFKAAYELLAQDQRDISPELAASKIREQPTKLRKRSA